MGTIIIKHQSEAEGGEFAHIKFMAVDQVVIVP